MHIDCTKIIVLKTLKSFLFATDFLTVFRFPSYSLAYDNVMVLYLLDYSVVMTLPLDAKRRVL